MKAYALSPQIALFRKVARGILPCCLMAALVLTSCDANEQEGGRKRKGGDNADSSEKGKKDIDSGDDKEEATGTTDDNDDDTNSDDQVKALLADCGAPEESNDPDKVIYEKELSSFPVTKNILIVTVKVESKLNITVTGKETKQDAVVEVKQVSGLLSGLAKTEAERQAKAMSGMATLTNVPFSEYTTLSSKNGWDGVVCTFVPATKIVNERGGKKTVATFDPPLPSSVSPKAIAARYEAEIGKKRSFDDIKATIVESDNTSLAQKKSVTGSVTVERVEPEAEVDNGTGGKEKIKADLAYKVTYDFGSPEITFALGLAPEVTYYISHQKRDLVANIIDTSAANGALAAFIHD